MRSTHPSQRRGDDASAPVDVNERFLPLLAQTVTAMVGERGREVDEGIDGGHAPRHVADLLIDRLVQAIDARREVLGQLDLEDDHALTLDTLLLVGAQAVAREHERLRGEWENGSDDLRALANHTELLSDLSDCIATAGRPA
jgi:hypothetical protein